MPSRLYDDSGRPLLPVPGPDYPLPYDEIIWPWELDGKWISMRRNALLDMRGWRNMHPSSRVSVYVYTDYTDKGMAQDFRAVRTKARRIEISTSDPAVLDNLKYFPETRELLILAYCSLDDALSVLHYMPHLRRLEVFNEQYHQGKPVSLSEGSMRGIASLQELRFLRLSGLDVDDDGFRHLAGMKNLLYMNLINAPVTSKIFLTIATWPRIRYLTLDGLNFDQPLDPATARALDSLAGRIAILDMNLYCTDDIATRIHESLEPAIEKIWKKSHLARQPSGLTNRGIRADIVNNEVRLYHELDAQQNPKYWTRGEAVNGCISGVPYKVPDVSNDPLGALQAAEHLINGSGSNTMVIVATPVDPGDLAAGLELTVTLNGVVTWDNPQVVSRTGDGITKDVADPYVYLQSHWGSGVKFTSARVTRVAAPPP